MNPTTFSSHSAVAAAVTTIACAWLLVAGATMVTSPTDTQVAKSARITVHPGPVMPAPQTDAAVAIAPEAHFRIDVEARRA